MNTHLSIKERYTMQKPTYEELEKELHTLETKHRAEVAKVKYESYLEGYNVAMREAGKEELAPLRGTK